MAHPPGPEGDGLAHLEDTVFDLLVVGGGINGAGIARDAALRGLSVCLVERNDWGWGTSSKSSMLAHGGLRYLEQFELGLVHESLQEREHLLRQAPHLVRPLRFLYPLYPDVAARRTVRVGLWLYDLLSHGKSVPKRRFLKPAQALEEVPSLNPEGLKGGATYYDAQIRSVERLVAELVWDADRNGAVCRNHTAVTALQVEDRPAPDGSTHRACTGAVVQDRDGHTATVRARAVVNAAGPWVDDVLGPLGAGRPPKIRKTKGTHLVVPRFLDTALIVRAASDGRTFFILPWKQHCLIGTTDTDYPGDPGQAAADPEDVQYLLDAARRYVPDAPLDALRFTTAGVRPLVNQEGLTESNVTRRHVLYDHGKEEGVHRLWSVQGGKITTYRSLAEEAVDRVCKTLGKQELAKVHPTRNGTLPGGPLVAWETFREEAVAAAVKDFGIPLGSAEHLVDTYGARWRKVLAASDADADRKRIAKGHPHLWVEVLWAVEDEDARSLADVLLRRTDLGVAEGGLPEVAERVLGRMAEWLGWDEARRERERRDYQEQVAVLSVPEP